jgi:hypothetical protein
MIAVDEGRGDYERRDDHAKRIGAGRGGGSITDVCAALRLLPGYDGSKQQVLSHDADGNCAWLDVETCETEAGY